jgi:mono/diheme cytochrome c family protein
MRRAVIFLLTVTTWVCVLVVYSNAQGQRQGRSQAESQNDGWTIPKGAAAEKSPLTVNDALVANGKKLFAAKCQRCHGPLGKGDGPDADPKHRHHMDLTSADGAKDNPDGVVFYRIWNGRTGPKMPTFSEELSKEQVWTVVAYVQTLRSK